MTRDTPQDAEDVEDENTEGMEDEGLNNLMMNYGVKGIAASPFPLSSSSHSTQLQNLSPPPPPPLFAWGPRSFLK